jgi:hypothetical protein
VLFELGGIFDWNTAHDQLMTQWSLNKLGPSEQRCLMMFSASCGRSQPFALHHTLLFL